MLTVLCVFVSENVLIQDTGKCRILDFGFGRCLPFQVNLPFRKGEVFYLGKKLVSRGADRSPGSPASNTTAAPAAKQAKKKSAMFGAMGHSTRRPSTLGRAKTPALSGLAKASAKAGTGEKANKDKKGGDEKAAGPGRTHRLEPPAPVKATPMAALSVGLNSPRAGLPHQTSSLGLTAVGQTKHWKPHIPVLRAVQFPVDIQPDAYGEPLLRYGGQRHHVAVAVVVAC